MKSRKQKIAIVVGAILAINAFPIAVGIGSLGVSPIGVIAILLNSLMGGVALIAYGLGDSFI